MWTAALWSVWVSVSNICSMFPKTTIFPYGKLRVWSLFPQNSPKNLDVQRGTWCFSLTTCHLCPALSAADVAISARSAIGVVAGSCRSRLPGSGLADFVQTQWWYKHSTTKKDRNTQEMKLEQLYFSILYQMLWKSRIHIIHWCFFEMFRWGDRTVTVGFSQPNMPQILSRSVQCLIKSHQNQHIYQKATRTSTAK